VPVLEFLLAVAKCRIQNPTTRKTSTKENRNKIRLQAHWQLDFVKKIGLGQLDPTVQTKIASVSSPYRESSSTWARV